jgi:RNA polymerase sigma factor (sigma-70 family)
MAARSQQDVRHRQAVAGYYQNHDEAPLGTVLAELRPRLLALARGTFGVHQMERAEDLVQEVLAWLLLRLRAGDYLGTGTLAAYAGAHLRFVFLNSRRARPSEPGTDDDPFRTLGDALPAEQVEPDAGREAAALLTAATAAVLDLDPSARAAVVLTYYQGLGPAEAAARLGVDEQQYGLRLARGLQVLRQWGQQHGAPSAEVYASLSGLDTGNLFTEPLRLAS